MDPFFHNETFTPPKQLFGDKRAIDWLLWELPIHALSNFFVPLIVYFINCTVFDEKKFFSAGHDKKTTYTSLRQHVKHAIECSISLWVWQSLVLNVNRTEPDMTTWQCCRNAFVHFMLADAGFYWCHYICHQKWAYELVHKQHHTHKATPSAEFTMSALSGTCVTFLDMVIIGHIPVFAPCLVVSLPWGWMIGLIAYFQLWISLLHCVGSRTGQIPSLGGLLVHPHDHHAHHKYGRENVNYGILLSFWDRLMGTYQQQDPNNFFYVGNKSSNKPQQPLLKVGGSLNTKPMATKANGAAAIKAD